MQINSIRAISFVVLVGGTVLVGMLAGQFGSDPASEWYTALEAPPGMAPDIAFAAVWTALYVMMGIAAWRVWVTLELPWVSREGNLYGAQLALNLLWPFLFFQAQRPLLALVEIVVLLTLVVATTRAFWKVDRPAGWLLVPYVAWVSYATYLNAGFWWLNQ